MKRIHRNKVQLVEEPGGINVPQLVFFIRKNILWFLGFAALGLLAALFYIKVFPQKYTVSSILVAQNNNNAQALSLLPLIIKPLKILNGTIAGTITRFSERRIYIRMLPLRYLLIRFSSKPKV